MTDGRRDPSEYVTIIAEVFLDTETGRKRVRAIQGQVYPPTMKIECAKEIRELPLETKVRLRVVDTKKEDGKPFLYNSYKWAFEIVK